MTNSPRKSHTPNPWLRGTHSEVPAVGRAVLHALELVAGRSDKVDGRADRCGSSTRTAGADFYCVSSAAHCALDGRILSYAEANSFRRAIVSIRKGWGRAAGVVAELPRRKSKSHSQTPAERIRVLATANLDIPRFVGRKQLPTSIGGALIHVADHTQRHVGQGGDTAKVLRALRASCCFGILVEIPRASLSMMS